VRLAEDAVSLGPIGWWTPAVLRALETILAANLVFSVNAHKQRSRALQALPVCRLPGGGVLAPALEVRGRGHSPEPGSEVPLAWPSLSRSDVGG
jgi:hypothetical protein